MKIGVQGQNDGWIIDNIIKDYKSFSKHQVVKMGADIDLAWYANLFGFHKVTCNHNVIYIHHINESQLSSYNFDLFNRANACMVPSRKSKEVAEKYLKIPVYHFPQWILSSYLEATNKERVAKLKTKIGSDHFVIGSFVKDGNGSQGAAPKYAKNPEKFIQIVRRVNEIMPVKVILAGYARNYTISKLKENGITFEYFQKYPNINDLYDLIDCYLVTSRVEGGPQSAYEASYRKVKIFSTDVGVAPDVLHPSCICDTADEFVSKIISKGKYEFEYNYDKIINNHMHEKVIPKLDEFFEKVVGGKS